MLFFNLTKLPVAVCLLTPGFPSCSELSILLAQLVLFLTSDVCSQTDDTRKQMFWLCTRIPTQQRLAAASLVSPHKFLLGLRKARCQHLGRSFCDLCSCNFLLYHYMIPFFLLLLPFSHLSFQRQGSTCSRRYKIFFLLQFRIRSHFSLVFKSLVYKASNT